MVEAIETERLRLVPCDEAHFEALIEGDHIFAERYRLVVLNGYLEFPEALPHGLQTLREHPEWRPWWTYLFVSRAMQAVVGLGGYKGPPGTDGVVEIGYGIAPAARGQGLATEAADGLVRHALRQPGVAGVAAHTLAEQNASTRVLEKCGFRRIGELRDDNDGVIWQWRRTADVN